MYDEYQRLISSSWLSHSSHTHICILTIVGQRRQAGRLKDQRVESVVEPKE